MPNTYTPPIISVTFDMDYGFRLMATSHGRAEIAGERIFRAEPWPDIAWSHAVEADAERDAVTLRLYLTDCASGKRREVAATRARAWWED